MSALAGLYPAATLACQKPSEPHGHELSGGADLTAVEELVHCSGGILKWMPEQALRLYPTEAAAKKAGQQLASFDGPRLATVLYALLPAGEKKATYLLSSTYRLTVAEQRWAEEHHATVTKLGRFPAGGSFMPLQTNMLRKKKPVREAAE